MIKLRAREDANPQELSAELSAEFSAALKIAKRDSRVVRVFENEKVVAEIIPVNQIKGSAEDEQSETSAYRTWGESLRTFLPRSKQ